MNQKQILQKQILDLQQQIAFQQDQRDDLLKQLELLKIKESSLQETRGPTLLQE